MGSLADYVAGGKKRYEVTAACVVAITIAGGKGTGNQYVYHRGILPLSTDPGQVQHLLDLGMIREIEGGD